MDSSTSQMTPTRRTSSIEKLPVELLYMIARSLPNGDISGMGFYEEAEEIPLPTRPSDLYPLARTCKGFWNCLLPLLYEFDIDFCNTLFTSNRDSLGPEYQWVEGKLPLSALSWGIEHNEMGTVKLALSIAKSMDMVKPDLSIAQSESRLERYAGADCYRLKVFDFNLDKLFPSTLAVIPDAIYVAALVQAVVNGNTAMVKVLAQVADATMLNRAFDYCQARLDDVFSYNHYGPTNMGITPLHLAIILRHFDIVEVLLTRYSQLESTLKWYEPSALSMAAYLGDVDMARLILDGTSLDSPWTARAWSQLVFPEAYIIGSRGSGEPRPPMIMAGLGMEDGRLWRQNGDDIFSFLAAQGGEHLLTEPFDFKRPNSGRPDLRRPLDLALSGYPVDNPEGKDVLPFDKARILALIKIGAFSTIPIHLPTERDTICLLWDWLDDENYHIYWSSEVANGFPQVQFMADCWDAAVEWREGNIDDQFIGYWVGGVTTLLDWATYHFWEYMEEEGEVDVLCNMVQGHLALISMLESKAPGRFAQHPPIRHWLDRMVFRRSTKHKADFYRDLSGDWEHLR